MLKLQRKIFLTILCLHSCGSFAETITAVCEEPKGIQTDYFSDGKLFKLEEWKFQESETRMTGAKPTLIWDSKVSSATFITPNSGIAPEISPISVQIITTKLIHIYGSKDQHTFVGNLGSDPVMFTIYINEQVAAYSRHSSWTEGVKGMHAVELYMKCNIKVEQK